jgi:hypothetical protein
MQLIRKNLHPDYHIEYKAELDDFLEQLHNRKKPLPVTLPDTIIID